MVPDRISCRNSAARSVQACSSGGLTASAFTSSRWSPCSGLGTFATTAQWSPDVTSAETIVVPAAASGATCPCESKSRLASSGARSCSLRDNPNVATEAPSVVHSTAVDGPSTASSTSMTDAQSSFSRGA